MRKQTPESGVLRACLDLLAAEKIWHERRNTGAMRDGKRFVRFSRPGTADILATVWTPQYSVSIRPELLWIECKAPSGRQTPEQKAFEKEVSQAGHHYLLVRDVDTLRTWLKEHGAI